uniref:Uncharacterized protein n=1 Tax=Plectus sambesii TaxID=2011161 RepID=A0A914VQ69_9BILA
MRCGDERPGADRFVRLCRAPNVQQLTDCVCGYRVCWREVAALAVAASVQYRYDDYARSFLRVLVVSSKLPGLSRRDTLERIAVDEDACRSRLPPPFYVDAAAGDGRLCVWVESVDRESSGTDGVGGMIEIDRVVGDAPVARPPGPASTASVDGCRLRNGEKTSATTRIGHLVRRRRRPTIPLVRLGRVCVYARALSVS